MARFETVSDETIKRGECTDIYFVRTEETLKKEDINPMVSMEVTASALPDTWAVFCGLSDVVSLLEGLPVTVNAMPEGTLFYKNEPVVRISGRYRDFCRYETAILGFLCHASELPPLLPISRSLLRADPSIPLGHAASTLPLPR
jgi:nicotinate phosphoribosyltransferase